MNSTPTPECWQSIKDNNTPCTLTYSGKHYCERGLDHEKTGQAAHICECGYIW